MNKYSVDIMGAVFDDAGIAVKSGWVKIYHCHPENREFIGAGMDFVHQGFSIPADAYLDAPHLPEQTKNIAICRNVDGSAWVTLVDYRGRTAYKTATGEPIVVDFIGELPETLTLIAPSSPFDHWLDGQWVTDTSAQHAAAVSEAETKKISLLAEASTIIAPLSDALAGGYITDEDSKKLLAWQKYRYSLTKVDTSLAEKVVFPVKPDL